MKTSHLVSGALVAALGAGAAWHWHAGAGAAEPAAGKADDASVLVRVQPAARKPLDRTLDAFGEIAAGKPESLSFPQAGQLLQLPALRRREQRRMRDFLIGVPMLHRRLLMPRHRDHRNAPEIRILQPGRQIRRPH